ncbi:MAG: molybdopterin-dependent oxidoreductase [Chitinispirillaceae bacterium]|nr:molybdopterin-dependent oxidoreductase [Chitinispirillaceae bacterium]
MENQFNHSVIYQYLNRHLLPGIIIAGFFMIVLSMTGCTPENDPLGTGTPDTTEVVTFPDFFTANEDFFITRINGVPNVDPEAFRLEITGLVDTPRSYSLQELSGLSLVSVPLTFECISNGPNAGKLGTAVWKGFRLYDLLVSLGLDSSATGVKYTCADGYFASNTLEQVKDENVIGALYMNDTTLPPEQGFPMRMLSPGYYGVKQPMWVTGIEVSGQPLTDYWEDRGWSVSAKMVVNSKIFFPEYGSSVATGDTLFVGGAAYGGTRIAGVQVTTDNGSTWNDAEIVQSIDADHVWVFWEAKLLPTMAGNLRLYARAIDIYGETQPQADTNYLDGSNTWPYVSVEVVE